MNPFLRSFVPYVPARESCLVLSCPPPFELNAQQFRRRRRRFLASGPSLLGPSLLSHLTVAAERFSPFLISCVDATSSQVSAFAFHLLFVSPRKKNFFPNKPPGPPPLPVPFHHSDVRTHGPFSPSWGFFFFSLRHYFVLFFVFLALFLI